MESPIIDSTDHRIVQGAIMNRHQPKWTNKSEQAVRKTWPQHIKFIENAQEYARRIRN